MSLTNRFLAGSDAVEIGDAEYQAIHDFLISSCGVVIGPNKQYLVKNRLAPVLVKYQLCSFAELAVALRSLASSRQDLEAAVIDAMTTNETFWFRDENQFVELKQNILPNWFRQKKAGCRIWSAACSSGQEPYSIAMCALEAGGERRVQILATDISETVLKDAAEARYSPLALSRGIDETARRRYFRQEGESYQLLADVSRLVRFQHFNLLKPYGALGRFDVVFCRNVLIYFSDANKRDILIRIADSLEPGGFLFLSSTEAVPADLNALYEPVRGGAANYYRKVG